MRKGFCCTLVFAGLLGVAGCGREQAYQQPPTPVTVQAVQEFEGAAAPRYSGTIEPNERVDVAFRLGGYVTEILQAHGRAVDQGDYVARGTVLARLREADYAAKVNEAESQLSQATAGVAQAKSVSREAETAVAHSTLDFGRAATLFRSQSLTKPEYDAAKTRLEIDEAKRDEARAALALAEARVTGARARLDESRLALRDTAVTAPIDGWILRRNIEVGSLAGPGAAAFVLADTRIVKVVFGAPDVLLPDLRTGGTIPITTDAIPTRRFTGRIARISPAADPRSRVFEVEVSVANADHALKPGMIASLEAPAAKLARSVPVVPLGAVVKAGETADTYGVFVLEHRGAETVPRSRVVRLGQIFGNLVVVSEGLTPGEKVILRGATQVREGEPVQVVTE